MLLSVVYVLGKEFWRSFLEYVTGDAEGLLLASATMRLICSSQEKASTAKSKAKVSTKAEGYDQLLDWQLSPWVGSQWPCYALICSQSEFAKFLLLLLVVSVSAGDADAQDLSEDVGRNRSFCTVASNGEFPEWYKIYGGRVPTVHRCPFCT
jgi:hypothetical protein